MGVNPASFSSYEEEDSPELLLVLDEDDIPTLLKGE